MSKLDVHDWVKPDKRVIFMFRFVTVIVFILSIHPIFAFSAEKVKIDAYLDNAAVVAGNPVRITIEVISSPEVNLEIPQLKEKQLDGIAVSGAGVAGPDNLNGMMHLSFWYELQPQEPGNYRLGPIAVSYRLGNQTLEAETDTLYLAVLKEAAETLKPLKVLKERPPFFDRYRQPVFSILIAIILAVAYYLYSRKKPPALEPLISPRERAVADLEALKLYLMAHPGDIRSYCFKISEVVRRYIEGEFQISALDATSSEITGDGQLRQAVSPVQFDELVLFFDLTDMVKFAKRNLARDEIDRIYSISYRLVSADPIALGLK